MGGRKDARVVLVVAWCALLAAGAPARAAWTEEPGSPIAVAAEPWWATAADFNGDGRPDVAVANDTSASPTGSVSILLRQPLGGFTTESSITVGGRPDSLTAADFDGDGRRDLAVANYLSSTVTVLLRRADNTGFTPEGEPLPVGTSPHAVAAGDLNGDGRPDLVTAGHASSTVTVLLRNPSNDGFVEEGGSPIAVGTNPTQIALADFDGDGRRDIAVVNRGSDDLTILLRATTNDGFTAEAGGTPFAGDAPVGIASADFNGDGRPDLAVAGEASGDLTVLLRQAGGGFAAAPGSPHLAGDGAYGVVTDDFDGDLVADLAVTAFEANRVTVLHGTGDGGFQPAPTSPLPTAKGPLVPAAADFDGNGRADLAIPNHGAHTLTIRLSHADLAAPPVPAPADGCTPPTSGRVSLWRGEDNARDSVGTNDASLEHGGAYRDGLVGRAFSLPGSDDYLHVADRPGLGVTDELTFDGWVQLDNENFGAPDSYGVGGDRVIAAKPDATDTRLSFAFWIEGDVPATAASAPLAFAGGPRSDPTTAVTSDPLAWQQGTWYHVAVVRNGDGVRFYRDGQPVGAATIGGTADATTGAPVGLGGSINDATVLNPIMGGIDEAQLWNRALSGDEVRAIAETATGACAAPPPPPDPPPADPPPPPDPPAAQPPRNLIAPVIVQQQICRTPIGGTPQCSPVPNTYECRPGTWEGNDPARPFRFSWQRMPTGTTEATGSTYRAASNDPREVALRSWRFRCMVEAFNDTGVTAAFSPEATLEPVYDASAGPLYGNFGVRGIDVFQTVQPNAGARMYGFNPADTWPQDNGTGSQNVNFWASTPFTDYPGGGTPTDWRKDGSRVDADPQQVPYDGVTLDIDKVATAIVYVNMLGGRAAYPNTELQLELSGTSNGAPIPFSPRSIFTTVKNPPTTTTRFVTAAQRASTEHGIQMQLPAPWLRVPRLELKAVVKFSPANYDVGMRECSADPTCGDDNRFTLRGVEIAVGSERPAQLLIQPVPMADGRQNFPSAESVLAVPKHLFPGGSRMQVRQYVGTQDITYAVLANTKDGTCKASNDRDCQMGAVMAVLDKWVADNPPRPTYPTGGHVQRYDIAVGVHDYQIANTPDKEPGFAWNGTVEYIRTGPPAAPFGPGGPRMTVTASTRPLTAAGHELGHTLSMAHLDKCPMPPDRYNVPVWPPDNEGRLQSTKFDARALPGVRRPDVDTPATPLFDLMSYCGTESDTGAGINSGDAWLSARNWNHTYLALREMAKRVGSNDRPVIAQAAGAGAARAASAGSAAPTAAVGTAFAVGSVGPGGGTIFSVTPSDGNDAVPAPVKDSPFRLRALDTAGQVIADAGVRINESTSHHGLVGGGTFVGPVPPAAATVELVHNDTVLHRLTRSRAPRLRLLAPRRGQRVLRSLDVRWAASDPDRSELDATIDFSHDDGRTWKNVFGGRSTGRARIPGRLLVASDAARIRVAVSDGFNETAVVSARFRATGRPPVVTIERPLKPERLTSAGRSALVASAFDDRDVLLRGRSIAWYAGGRLLGRGDRLSAQLPAGRYLLRAVATDRLGRTAAASRRVRVAAEPLRLLELTVPPAVERGTRRIHVTVRASAPATLAIGARRYRVGTRATRIIVALPSRPARGLVRLRGRLRAPGRRALRAKLEVLRV